MKERSQQLDDSDDADGAGGGARQPAAPRHVEKTVLGVVGRVAVAIVGVKNVDFGEEEDYFRQERSEACVMSRFMCCEGRSYTLDGRTTLEYVQCGDSIQPEEEAEEE